MEDQPRLIRNSGVIQRIQSPGGEIGRRRGLRPNLSPLEEILEVKPVKLGEGPGRKSELIPSQALVPKG